MIRTARLAVALISLALVVACGSNSGDGGSARSAAEAARELAALAVEFGVYERDLDSGADLAWSSSVQALTLELGREPTDAERTRVVRILRDVLGEFLTVEVWQQQVADVYSKHFTGDELGDMIRFYSSPVGRKTLQLESKLVNEVDQAVDEALSSELEQFVERVDEEIAKAFEELGGKG